MPATPAQEEQFERTCALVREVGFDRVNTAAYSPRPGTPAALRPDQVAELVKLDRLNRLNRVVTDVAAERAQRFLGRDVEVSQPWHYGAESCVTKDRAPHPGLIATSVAEVRHTFAEALHFSTELELPPGVTVLNARQQHTVHDHGCALL